MRWRGRAGAIAVAARRREPRPERPLIAMVGAALGIAAVLTVAVAPLGYRIGLWGLETGLGDVPRVATYLGMAGLVVGSLGLLTAFRLHRRWALLALIGAVLGLVVATAPSLFHQSVHGAPLINDITTDTENPPAYEAVLPLREAGHAVPATYGGPSVAAQQQQAFPDIRPLVLGLPAERAFQLALDEARKAGWQIVASDPKAGRIEAFDRTLWYGFTDDVVVRIAAEGSGARLDIRSHSRLGNSDRGKNAERVRAYLAAVKRAAGQG